MFNNWSLSCQCSTINRAHDWLDIQFCWDKCDLCVKAAEFIILYHLLEKTLTLKFLLITQHSVTSSMMFIFWDEIQVQFSSLQLLSRVPLFATPWIAAHQASLSITNTQSSLKLMSIESVMPSSHLILVVPFSSCPQSLLASESFPMSQLFAWGGQSKGVSALVSFLPKNTQGLSPLEWTGWISLQSKGLSRVFSNITVQKHQFCHAQFSSQSNSPIHDHWKNHSLD